MENETCSLDKDHIYNIANKDILIYKCLFGDTKLKRKSCEELDNLIITY